jgi:hypothetical protein
MNEIPITSSHCNNIMSSTSQSIKDAPNKTKKKKHHLATRSSKKTLQQNTNAKLIVATHTVLT